MKRTGPSRRQPLASPSSRPRSGAGTAIGTEAVARASPDGDTLLLTAGGNLLIGAHVRKVNYDPLTNLAPICALVLVPGIIAVNATAPYRTLADLLRAARANPGQLIESEKLKLAANVDMIYVQYPGVAPAVNALLGEHVTSIITSYSSAAEQFKSGKLRALAMTSKVRIDAMPDIPTVAKSRTRTTGRRSGSAFLRRLECQQRSSPGWANGSARLCGPLG